MAEYFPISGFLVLILTILSRMIWLQRKGIRVINRGRKATGRAAILPVAFFFVLVIWITELLRPVSLFMFSFLPEAMTTPFFQSGFLTTTGAVMIVLAICLNVLSLMHFRYSLRFGLDGSNAGKLVTSGIFSITRNPFFLSLIIYFSGIALIFINAFFLLFTIAAVAGIHRYILREEKFLVSVYGDAYRQYMAKTARYL